MPLPNEPPGLSRWDGDQSIRLGQVHPGEGETHRPLLVRRSEQDDGAAVPECPEDAGVGKPALVSSSIWRRFSEISHQVTTRLNYAGAMRCIRLTTPASGAEPSGAMIYQRSRPRQAESVQEAPWNQPFASQCPCRRSRLLATAAIASCSGQGTATARGAVWNGKRCDAGGFSSREASRDDELTRHCRRVDIAAEEVGARLRRGDEGVGHRPGPVHDLPLVDRG